MKKTIEIDDTLEETVNQTIQEVKDFFFEWCDENEPSTTPCISNDLDYSGRIHEIIDGSVPIYYHEIDTMYYLHGHRLDQAYDLDRRLDQDKTEDNWKQVAIFSYLDQAVREAYDDQADEWFEEWEEKTAKNKAAKK
jgi:hypothetical protein